MNDNLRVKPTPQQTDVIVFALQEKLLIGLELTVGLPINRKKIHNLLLDRAKEQGKDPDLIKELGVKINSAFPQ